jgi:hypothetical protein
MYHTTGDYCGFLCSLFDFNFSHYVTPKVIKVLYILAVILFLIFTILMIIGAFQISVARGIVTLIIIGPVYFFVTATVTRIALEIVMVLFRIGEHVAKLAGVDVLRPLTEPGPPSAAAPAEGSPAVPPPLATTPPGPEAPSST